MYIMELLATIIN